MPASGAVTAITTVNNRHIGADVFGDKVRGTRISMTHDKHIGSHGFKGAQGIGEGFTFLVEEVETLRRDDVSG